MRIYMKRLGAAVLAVGGLLALDVPGAYAQRRVISGRAFPVVQNMYPAFQPTFLQRSALQNWAFNTAVIGNSYAQIPPWVFGYNPYPPAYAGAYYGGGGGGFNPLMSGGYAGGYANPYASAYGGGGYGGGGYPGGYGGGGYGGGGYGGYSQGYNPYFNPGYYTPDAGFLYGSAAVMSSYGQLTLQQEQARLLREQVNQAKLDTKKKRFDTLAYIRDNTPTFGQEQARVARNTLQRMLTTATPAEIYNGKSINILVNALVRTPGQKSSTPPLTLDEETIKHLNVTKKYGNLGLLRNNGKLVWPSELRKLVGDEERNNIDNETQRLFRQAANAQVNPDTLRDLRNELEKIREKLVMNANVIRQVPYMEAKRFLNDFEDALTALSNGDATAYFNFQSQFAGGEKTVEDLVQYMAKSGLRFAPATNGDETAYQALHDALVAYSMGMENLAAALTPRSKE